MEDLNISRDSLIINSNGEILFFGLNRFIDDIAKGNCCFICGAKPGSKVFNDEHIIPDWVLRKYKLHDKRISLPNGTHIPYGKYTVPCCKDCNSQLGALIETPISKLLNKSYNEIIKEIEKDNEIVYKIFRWLSLIYLKTHLKDKSLSIDRDARKASGKIGDFHIWEDIHHVHCIARSHYTKIDIDKKVYGSIFIFPVIELPEFNSFDYIDSMAGKVVMIQLGAFCIVVVLDDACAAYSIYKNNFQKITGPLSPFQVREIVAHMKYINVNLKERPLFYSSFKSGKFKMYSKIPKKFYLLDKENEILKFGEILHFYIKDIIGEFAEKEEILDSIKSGDRSYLFNENSEFINHSNFPVVSILL